MSTNERLIDAKSLHDFLILDIGTGQLVWKSRNPSAFIAGINGRHTAEHRCANWNSKFANKAAFCTEDMQGYLHGFLFNKQFSAARVVFAMVNGYWPINHIDHINGIKTDNRPTNIRDVPRQENMRNRAISSNSATGIHGISLHLGKYDAYITDCGKKRHLGRFSTLSDAHEARKCAEHKLGYHENHGRSAL